LLLAAVSFVMTALPAFPQPSEPSPPCGAPVKAIELSPPLQYTDDSTVLRALVSRVGNPHCEGNLALDRERLDRLGFFSEAKLETVPEDDGLALKVTLVETAPYLPNVGVGHTEENGVAAGPGLKALNLARTGITLSAGTRFGGWTQAYLNFSNPSIPGGHWSYDVLFAYQDREDTLNGFQRKTLNTTGFLGKTIGETHTLRGVFQLSSTKSDQDGITLSDTNRDVIPYLGAEWTYDSRDLWSNPHRGWHNTFDVRKAFGAASFWRLQADLRTYVPLADRHTLAVLSLTNWHSGELGVDFPTYLQSYVGGTNSVRGWELGARSGQNEMLNTVEYRYQLMKRRTWKVWKVAGYVGLELAVFGDLGIAWTEGRQFAANNFIGGYGGGLRLIVPWVSEIRLDFAAGEPGGGVRFQFGFGPKAVAQKAAAR
jgi:outer membrane protein insertion porin family